MVLELTLKHVKALSSLLEQQQQKIIALQKDLQLGKFEFSFLFFLFVYGCEVEMVQRHHWDWHWCFIEVKLAVKRI